MQTKQKFNYNLLASGNFNLDNISVNHQYITLPNTYIRYANEHRHDRLLLIVSGKCRFDIFNDSPITACEGDVIYIPYNIAYRAEWLTSSKGEIYSINYLMRDAVSKQITLSPEIQKFSNCGNNLTMGLFKECRNIFVAEDYGYELKCKYTLLKLLYVIICAQNGQKQGRVEKAIRYIYTNFAEETTVSELAKMCNLGECMFRRNFKLETGTSPLKFRNNLRIQKAYDILVSEKCTVAKAMEATGFYDASYFNKLFKATIGYSPSEIKKNQNNI